MHLQHIANSVASATGVQNAVGKVHNKAKIQPAVRIDIRAFPKPKRQEEVCKDVANVMSPFVLANTMLPARTTMEEATFLLMPMRAESEAVP